MRVYVCVCSCVHVFARVHACMRVRRIIYRDNGMGKTGLIKQTNLPLGILIASWITALKKIGILTNSSKIKLGQASIFHQRTYRPSSEIISRDMRTTCYAITI